MIFSFSGDLTWMKTWSTLIKRTSLSPFQSHALFLCLKKISIGRWRLFAIVSMLRYRKKEKKSLCRLSLSSIIVCRHRGHHSGMGNCQSRPKWDRRVWCVSLLRWPDRPLCRQLLHKQLLAGGICGFDCLLFLKEQQPKEKRSQTDDWISIDAFCLDGNCQSVSALVLANCVVTHVSPSRSTLFSYLVCVSLFLVGAFHL